MRGCTIHVAKTKGLISCAVTAQLICGFVFACMHMRKAGFLITRLISWQKPSFGNRKRCFPTRGRMLERNFCIPVPSACKLPRLAETL